MKNNRLIALLIVCGVLDWWMVRSHRSHTPTEQVREVEGIEPVITVAKHELKKKSQKIAQSRHIRVC
jgi:hypothetical protein